MIGRRGMRRLLKGVDLQLEQTRFHHSPVYRNPAIRWAGLDDGYYLVGKA